MLLYFKICCVESLGYHQGLLARWLGRFLCDRQKTGQSLTREHTYHAVQRESRGKKTDSSCRRIRYIVQNMLKLETFCGRLIRQCFAQTAEKNREKVRGTVCRNRCSFSQPDINRFRYSCRYALVACPQFGKFSRRLKKMKQMTSHNH